MKCPKCQHENESGAKFCEECAAVLLRTCGHCGRQLSPTAKFCPECAQPTGLVPEAPAAERFASPDSYTPRHIAEKILKSRAVLEGERKQVTVLFVDVAGFTSLSERLDPEDVHGLMSRAFELMLAEVHRYEGTVNQFLGDGIMALFGAPVAHEDHAQRGVLAALGIASALVAYQEDLLGRGITFRARQGLNTGLVVVGSIGTDLRMDYTAVGDTTNVAARLQQASEPGRVTISETTHRLVQGYFETRPLGELYVKGKAEPVSAWEVVSAREARTRLEVEADRGLTTFVGRNRELSLLLESFERARAGQGQVVFLVGEAGIGKSRLLHEFRRRIGEAATWLEGHCLSFGRAMALHPLVDLLRRSFGIDEIDGDRAIAEKIEQGVGRADEDLRAIAPYLRALLSVDPGDATVRAMSPQERRGETFEALRRFIARAAERSPQVLVIEDLHWVDRATEEFLTTLVDSVPALRVLCLLTYRPGYTHPLGERSYYVRVAPAPLSAEESARMAAAVLASDELPEEPRRLVSEKAEGNPFYVEELVKSLAESGVLQRAGARYELARPLAEVGVPDTIQDVIAARIDRLEEAPKRILQLASVIGREFTGRLVQRLSEAGDRTDRLLQELKAVELIHERRLFPELTYMFKHSLTQDVAYNSLLVQRRKDLHRLVGLAIEDLYADRLAEHHEMLAHHFSRAEDWERALDYLLKAADKAVRAFGLREALALYADAAEVVRRLGSRVPVATLMTIHRARADLFFGLGEFVRSRAEAETLLDLCRRAGDAPLVAGALVQLASANQWEERFPESLEHAREAIEIAESAGALTAIAGGLYVRGYVRAVSGSPDEAEADLGSSLSIARSVQDAGRQGLALQMLALLRTWQGRYREGLELSAQGVEIAREHRLVIPLIRCLWGQGVAWADLGQYDAALAALGEGLALAERIGDDAYVPRYLNTLGWLHLDCGDFARGIELSERSYELTARSSRAGHATGAERRAFIRNNEADAFLAMGELSRAAEALDETHHVVLHPPAARWMTWRYTTHCYATLAQLALARGDPNQARRLADQSLEVAVPTRSRKYESWAWRIKGESATARHAWDEADEALRRSLEIARSIGQPRQTWMSRVALGRLHAACGRREEARACYLAAREIIDGLRAGVQDPGLRAGLGSSALVRRVEMLTRPE